MQNDKLFQFGDSSVATVYPSGIVDIRIVDHREHSTLTSIMQVDEFARIAKAVFINVRDDTLNRKEERDIADGLIGKIQEFENRWGC